MFVFTLDEELNVAEDVTDVGSLMIIEDKLEDKYPEEDNLDGDRETDLSLDLSL